MSNKSKYLEDAILNAVLRNTAYTSPATVYVALYTAAPSDTGGGTEPAVGAYAREPVAFAAVTSPDGDTEQVVNSADIVFPAATAAYGPVVAFGIFDALTVGNLLYWNTLAAGDQKSVAIGDQFKIPAGDLVIQEK